MLKISETRENGTVTLQAEGKAIGPWVVELRMCSENALAGRDALRLDLRDVEYADASALELFSELKSRGALLLNCSPFLAAQLETKSASKGG